MSGKKEEPAFTSLAVKTYDARITTCCTSYERQASLYRSPKIAARTITVVPGMTGVVDRLESAGLVRRDRSAKDRRVIFATLPRHQEIAARAGRLQWDPEAR
jgi:DNA-binding MarR family transcriptional regulator